MNETGFLTFTSIFKTIKLQCYSKRGVNAIIIIIMIKNGFIIEKNRK
jgi:hypothetical protein